MMSYEERDRKYFEKVQKVFDKEIEKKEMRRADVFWQIENGIQKTLDEWIRR